MDMAFFIAIDVESLTRHGFTAEHIEALVDVAHDMLEREILTATFLETSPVHGSISTNFKPENVGTIGGFGFTALVSTDVAPSLLVEVSFIAIPASPGGKALTDEEYMRRSNTSVMVN